LNALCFELAQMSEAGLVDERSHGGAIGYRLRLAAQAT
jgi:hypothetical protein